MSLNPIPFSVSPVFEANYNATEDIVINQGGTDSGKTYAIVQILIFIGMYFKAPKDDPIITVIGESVPNLKKGAYRVAKSIYHNNPEVAKHILSWNETDRTIYFKSGWVVEFISCSDEQSAKQGKRQYSFFNEANGIDYPIFWQIAKRTRVRTFLDYNPTAPFWAHEKLIGTNPDTNDLSATVKLIISDHRHNPFLSEKDHARTEGIKDKELWWVYARGKTGNLMGLIYPNWVKITDDKFPWDESFFAGLDFGYENDETAGVRIARVSNSIYLHEICYTSGLGANQIRQAFSANGFTGDNPIYCENDPEMISQLRRLGDLSYFSARKGPGSIKAGIKKMNEYQVYYTASSTNIDIERKKYMWLMDPVTNKPTNIPKGGLDHLLDAARYGVYTHFFRQ